MSKISSHREEGIFLADYRNPTSGIKSTEVIDDSITAPVSVEPEEEFQLCITKAPAGEPIQLKEERMFAQVSERGEQQEHRRWVLDTGATNHMTGAKSAFSKLESGIRGTVKFGDGSIVEIEGHDTILFVGKGGNYHKLTSVYFIPRLKANILSLGNSMRPAATFPSSAGYLRSAMIDDGCSRKFGDDKPPLHPKAGDRATSQPLGQVPEDGRPIRKR